jgi:hypothetical protein
MRIAAVVHLAVTSDEGLRLRTAATTIFNQMSLAEIKTAIKQLSFEERAELAAWLHGWKDDEWDDQMKRDIASGKLDDVLREVEEDIKSGRVREMP